MYSLSLSLSLCPSIQCKFYCYCNSECQIYHWKKGGHCGECKHLALLRKYHEPNARSFRDLFAGEFMRNRLSKSTRKSGKRKKGKGKKNVAALKETNDRNQAFDLFQELRGKLGLTRPRKDYEMYSGLVAAWWDDHRTKTPLSRVSKAINDNESSSSKPKPHELLVARKDGTVHVGSTPEMI